LDSQVRLKPFGIKAGSKIEGCALAKWWRFQLVCVAKYFHFAATCALVVLVPVEHEPLPTIEVPPSMPVGLTHCRAFQHEC
jgi:hypothetical protein